MPGAVVGWAEGSGVIEQGLSGKVREGKEETHHKPGTTRYVLVCYI